MEPIGNLDVGKLQERFFFFISSKYVFFLPDFNSHELTSARTDYRAFGHCSHCLQGFWALLALFSRAFGHLWGIGNALV